MNIILWVLQVLVAVAFLAHGLLFLFPPPDILVLMKPGSRRHSVFSLVLPKCWPRTDLPALPGSCPGSFPGSRRER